jgi:glycosyltransferase involved in cell wall biosynthesis
VRVRIVCYDPRGWIIGKFAARLREELAALSVTADVAQTPDPSSDINHHLVYVDVAGNAGPHDTVMVTHVDDLASIRLLRRQVEAGATGICVSRDTMTQMVRMGLPAGRLCYALPAHDEVLRPRPLLIGIATRLYPLDGRKREGMLLELASSIRSDDFRFVIIGSGWERIVAAMREKSFSVEYHPDFDAATYPDMMQSLDYYLYLGTDEGSMGFIDSLAAGVPTIATPQGFHLDAAEGLTQTFSTIEDLRQVFADIARPRRIRAESVAAWTWPNYARKHLDIWTFLLTGRRVPDPSFKDGLASLGTADPKSKSSERLAIASMLLRGSIQHTLLEWRGRFRRRARSAR